MKKALTVLSLVPLLAAGILFISPTHVSAAISFGTVNSNANENSPGSQDDLTITKPASTVSGDFLIAGITINGGDEVDVTSVPSGWTLIERTDNDDDLMFATYYKVAGGSEPASYTWAFERGDGGTVRAAGGIIRYTGVHASNPIDEEAENEGLDDEFVAPSVDTDYTNDRVVVFYAQDDDNTHPTPSGASERYDVENGDSSGPRTSAADFTQASIGSTGTKTIDSGSSNVDWITQTIALREALLNQTITFGMLAAKTYGDADFDLSASASSGLTVTFGASGACSMFDADTVHLTGSGNCTITASQTGNTTYNAATPVEQSFAIAQKSLTISGVTVDNKQYDGNTTGTIAGSAALVGVINSDDVMLVTGSAAATFADEDVADGIAVTVVGYTLSGTAAGSYLLSQPTGLTANITAKPLTVTALGLNKVYDNNTDAVVVLSTADIIAPDVVTLSYTAPAVFADANVGAGIAIAVDGISLGGAEAGNYSLQNTTASASASITPDLATLTVDDATFPYNGSAHSVDINGPTTNPTGLSYVITYNGSITAPTNAGVYPVIAFITDVNYAGSDTATLTITKLDQAITFGALTDRLSTDADFDVSATGGASGQPVTFVASGPCSMADADTVHMSGAAGTCTITASQAGSTNYNAAPDVAQSFAVTLPPAPSCDLNSSFDSFALGSVNGQGGWSSTGSFDQAIVANQYGYSTFGCQSLRISNAVTSGSFGDQTFSASTTNEAGETSAENGGYSGGTRQTRFEAQFDIASALPNAQQVGLSMVVSPDRGDGARMSYLRFEDQADGIHAFFYDYASSTFNQTEVGTFTRNTPHTIKFLMDFVDGAGNDIVKIYIDGSLVHTGTSWEDYFREQESNPTRTVDSLLFRVAGTAAPANSGKGFVIDNFNPSTSLTPVTPTPEPTPTPTPTSGGGGGGGQVVGSGSTAPSTLPTGIVLGASIGPAGETGGASTGGEVLGTTTVACTPLLTTYMRLGGTNNTAEVRALQTFLNAHLGATIPVTGFFGTATEGLVKQFQLKYKDEILTPWGLTTATGRVYKLTQYKINMLSCPALTLPYPTLN